MSRSAPRLPRFTGIPSNLEADLVKAFNILKPGPWIPLSFQNSWNDYNTVNSVTSHDTCAYRYCPLENIIQLRGVAAHPTGSASGTIIANIPDPYRPIKRMIMSGISHTGAAFDSGEIDIGTGGNLTIQTSANIVWQSLTGLWYPLDVNT